MPWRGRLGTGTGRLVAAAIAAALVAELAALALSPADTGPEPIPVDAERAFDSAQIERGREYRDGGRTLLLVGLGVELAALGLLAAGRPRSARRVLERAGARPLLGAAAAGAGISLVLALLSLPTAALAHERAVEVGLSTQDVGGWLADQGRSAAITAILAAVGAALLVGIQRRLPRAWWALGAGVVVLYATVSSWLAPIVLAPIFNDFEPLGEGPARRQVLTLTERAGVDVGDVLRVDASRRSTALNAYVDGIGSSKRVVLYDNLLDRTEGAELRAVVAHELGHVAHRDIPRGLLFVALVAPLGMLTVALAGTGLARRVGSEPGTPAAVPAYALALTVVAFAAGLAGSQLSREVEASADRFALELTGDPAGFIDLQRRLALTNLSDPDPSSFVDALLRTHPTTVERIGAAIAYRDERSEGAEGAS